MVDIDLSFIEETTEDIQDFVEDNPQISVRSRRGYSGDCCGPDYEPGRG